ncbi:hypothetical protein [Streptomyces sp. NBC_01483]|uniref:hypothetical protein n=1 Tax=Streptomyces sp. NBC_01483 TaxID=2903883 RepID=UPI002E373829|nr:hypothetical protein [Streptomyces sp. NBC_01483]
MPNHSATPLGDIINIRTTSAAALALAAVLLTGCSSDPAKNTRPRPTPSAQAPRSHGPFAGWGTTQAEWERHHVNDITLDHTGYDTDPRLGVYSMTWIEDRALNYSVELTPRSLSQAIQRVKAELPSDVRMISEGKRNGCYHTVFRSQTLERRLAPLKLRTRAGDVWVDYETTNKAGDTTYDAHRITTASLYLPELPDVVEPGCGGQL